MGADPTRASNAPRCRLCGSELAVGLFATDRRACCLNSTRIVGACPEHGPLGPHHVTDRPE